MAVGQCPPKGGSRKVQGTKVNRLHHLLSDVESACFLTWNSQSKSSTSGNNFLYFLSNRLLTSPSSSGFAPIARAKVVALGFRRVNLDDAVKHMAGHIIAPLKI